MPPAPSHIPSPVGPHPPLARVLRRARHGGLRDALLDPAARHAVLDLTGRRAMAAPPGRQTLAQGHKPSSCDRFKRQGRSKRRSDSRWQATAVLGEGSGHSSTRRKFSQLARSSGSRSGCMQAGGGGSKGGQGGERQGLDCKDKSKRSSRGRGDQRASLVRPNLIGC